MKLKPRPYQKEIWNKLDEFQKKGGNSALVVASTGTGKRYIAIKHAEKFKTVLFIVHTEELLQQAYNEFEEHYPMQTGIVKAELMETDKRFTITSIQTMIRRYEKFKKDRFELIIVDEFHHYLSKTWRKPLDYFTPKLMVGYTATPKRLDGLSFTGMVDEIVYEYNLDRAIPEQYLCNVDAMRIKTDISLKGVKKTAGDFNQKELSQKIDIPERNKLIVDRYIKHLNGLQSIVFCVNIEHAINLKNMFNNFGIEAEAIHSKLSSEQRSDINRRFLNGEIKVLTNVQILTEGFDYSDVAGILMARPTMSIALYMQMIGRGTRLKSLDLIKKMFNKQYFQLINKYKDKISKKSVTYIHNGKVYFKHYKQEETFNDIEKAFLKDLHSINLCKVLDFVDVTKQNKVVTCWSLEEGKSLEEKVLMSPEKKKKILEEKIKREYVIKTISKRDKHIDLIPLPSIRVIKSVKMKDPATEKQIEFMKALGVYVEGNFYTKGQASELISSAPAKHNQIKYLANHGYDVSKGVSIGEFQIAKEKILEKQNTKRTNINNFPFK